MRSVPGAVATGSQFTRRSSCYRSPVLTPSSWSQI